MADQGERPTEDEIRSGVAASSFHASIGITVEQVRPGSVDLRLDAGPDHANLQGTVHGGVLATLADTAAGLAVRSAIPPGSRHVSVNLDVQYLAPATTGTLLATGRVLRMGRRIAFAEADVTDAAGVLAASGPARPRAHRGVLFPEVSSYPLLNMWARSHRVLQGALSSGGLADQP